MSFQFDEKKMARLVRARRGKQSLRSAAKKSGISAATLYRIEKSGYPDMETFTALCNWMKVPPGVFFKSEGEEEQLLSPSEKISMLIETDHLLDPVVSKVLVSLVKAAFSEN